MNRLIETLPSITDILSKPIELEEPFVEMAARFAHEPGSVVLLSGGDLDCSRYNLMGLCPWLTLEGRTGETTAVVQGQALTVREEPLDVLEKVLEHCRYHGVDISGPISAGLFGYLAYDLKDGLETLPRTSVDDLQLPLLYFSAPTLLLVEDLANGTSRLHAPVFRGGSAGKTKRSIDAFTHSLTMPPPVPGPFSTAGRPLKSNFTRPEYVRAVQRIRAYIAAGDVYQVNMSQRFETGFKGDSYALFKRLFELNPAPFFAYVNAGSHQIVSTSPERFLQRKGRCVETRPIKGTRPRGKTPDEDRKMKAELSQSPKDDAELSMIVDLLRNDLGKVCEGGSVFVKEHKRLEAYQNVYHLVSDVEGVLAEKKNSVDLIRAAFPGGSITGCPKIRSMEIIDELESRRRHVYTGSIGYIGFHDTMDLSIAIRTATIADNRLVFSVGGGIVFDSDPQDEFEETLHKGQTLMSVFDGPTGNQASETSRAPWIWHNGLLMPHHEATVPVSDLGLQYGFGFFETIRVQKGAARFLSEHIKRFNRTWSELFPVPPPDLTWEEIIHQVIKKNDLENQTAAVKLLATRGDGTDQQFNGSLSVTAKHYVHRLERLQKKGLKLAVYPHPRMSPLADHKTLNYLYYFLAGVWAKKKSADEAVILNPDGSLSETNTANLIHLSDRKAILPCSPHVLPGVMQQSVCRHLVKKGYAIENRCLHIDEIQPETILLLTNSLMGVVHAVSLNDQPLRWDPELIVDLNNQVM